MIEISGFSAVFLFLATIVVQSKTFPPLFEQKHIFQYSNITNRPEATNLNYRLPNETVPINYKVSITTNVHKQQKEFQGIVSITIYVNKDTSNITLHARQLTIDSAILIDGSTEIECIFSDPKNPREFLTITPKDKRILNRGKELILEIKYHGELRTDNGGFYLSTYKAENGETRWLATTQFESTNARHAFPCYDEPAKKATFEFSFTHGKNYTVICNTNPIGNPVPVPNSDLVTTSFKQTTKMSAYLTAFICSDFVFNEVEFRGLKQKVYSRSSTKHHREFALISAMQIIGTLDDYFGVEYKNMLPDGKLDQVAVPDFSAGAMENWGLTTYREEYLLYEEGKSTVQSKTNIANVIGHEDVHQWFGDYVSVEWWTYLWLKESFAQYYSYVANDKVNPLWDIFQYYFVSEYQRGMAADSGNNPRPMTHYVQTPEDISNLYDSITYSKGSAILRMFSHAITEEVFRLGLNKQLRDRAYQSAVEEQLFANIEKAAQAKNFTLPFTIDEMMGSWTRQGGHPLLTVRRNYKDKSFTIIQEQYFDNPYPAIKDNGKKFIIPFNYVKGSSLDFKDTVATHYLSKNEITIKDDNLNKDDFILLNKQSTGFYKIKYDEENYRLISEALQKRHLKFHVLNRAALIYDANKLSSSQRLSYDTLLSLLSYLEAEDDYAPWATANGIFVSFNFYFQGDKLALTNLKYFIHQLTNRVYDKLGAHDLPADRHFDRYLRSIIINLACMAGDEDCLKQTTGKLESFVKHNKSIETNLKSDVFCNGLIDADEATFSTTFEYMISSDNAAERSSLIQSLGCVQRQQNIEKYIASSLDDKRYKNNEQNGVLRAVYSKGGVGLVTSIDFLNKRYEEYYKLTPGFGGVNPLENDLMSMPAYIVSKDIQESYNNLLKKIRANPAITLRDHIEENSDAKIKYNMEWNDKNKPQISKWLSRYVDAKGGSSHLAASAFTLVSGLFILRYLM